MPKNDQRRAASKGHPGKKKEGKKGSDLAIRPQSHRLSVVDYAIIGTFVVSVVVPVGLYELSQQSSDSAKVASSASHGSCVK